MKGFLSSRGGRAVIVALGVALCAPSVTTGLAIDDWFQKLHLEHRPVGGMSRGYLDLFSFADGDPADTQRFMDAGLVPWWTDPAIHLSFWRPLTSLTHALDYLLWPGSPVAMHLHSLLWFGLGLIAVAWVYSTFLPVDVAGLALLLYAVDDAHGPAVGWISNRSAMVSLAFSLLALPLHHRWRSQGWRPGAWLAAAAFAAGLLGAEAAVAAAGYLAAYAMHLESGPKARRALSLVPYAAIFVVWRLAYGVMGYGTAHSGVYLDPAHEPGPFLALLPSRAVALLAAQFALPWSDFVSGYKYFSASLPLIMTVVATVIVAIVGLALAPLLKRDPVARMFATGALLAVVPICSTFPADRLLFYVGVGAMALVAAFLESPKSWVLRPVAWMFVGLHLILAPPLLAIRSRSMETVEKPIDLAMASFPQGPGVTDKTVVLVNPPSDPLAGFPNLMLAGRREPRPSQLRWLATGAAEVDVTREDANTLRVRPQRGFYEYPTEQLMRSPQREMPPGTVVSLAGLKIEVLQTEPDGRPAEARFRFDRALEDPSFVWRVWRGKGYVPFVPPAVGQTVTLEGTDLVKLAFDK